MNYLFEILKNLSHKKHLQKNYADLSQYVELLGAFIGIISILAADSTLTTLLNLEGNTPITSETPILLVVFVFSMVLPLAFFLGVFLVLSIFSLYMYRRASFTKSEAKSYILRLSYPEYRYQSHLRHMASRYE